MMTHRQKIFFLTFILFNFCLSGVASAAGNESLELKKTVGDYLIEIDYPNPFQAQLPIVLNFFLTQTENQTSASFSDVSVTIFDSVEKHVIFQTDIPKKTGIATAATITFPYASQYEIDVSFNNGSTATALATFPVTVGASTDNNTNTEWLTIGAGIGFILGLVLAPFMRRYESAVGDTEQK